ncbi:hypothetical protein [Tahibacter caeni]|uniref:hypothetical protein n=1 Tax=Tahibacter caeni TaxID=1453545 RepID=UPI002148FA95|nr:hypothetical protein [Tahibacter caeni]
MDLPVWNLAVSYGDDSATGSATYSDNGPKHVSVDFYIGHFPDTSFFTEQA